jgi:hypothetical protein
MAQETAGTIGIPVLKNEVLPYLTDYAKRRERAELYKQKAEQRAAELEAKKAAEVDKYVPPAFETAKGGYWQPAIKQRMEAEQKAALQRIASATTQAEKARAAQDYSAVMQELNYGGELETQKQKENLKSLQDSGYTADENALSQYYREQAATNPKFFDTNHITGFQKWLQNNPEKYISPAAIGTSLLKQFKPEQMEVTNRNRETERFEYNPLFTPERKYDEFAKADVLRADKVNPDAAFKALKSNPLLDEAAGKYIQNYAQKIKTPGMSDTEAYTLATDKFFGDALQQGRGGQKYDYSLQFKGAGRKSGRAPSAGVTASAPSTVVVKTYKTTIPKGKTEPEEFSTQQVKIGSDNDPAYTFKRDYTLDKNKSVVLLQPDDGTLADIIERNPTNGRYVLKQNIKFNNAVKRIVNTLDEDYISQKGTQNEQLLKAGTPVSNDFYNALMSGSYKGGRRPVMSRSSGYEVAGTVYDAANNPIKSISVFVPESQASTIVNAIKMGEVEETNNNPW